MPETITLALGDQRVKFTKTEWERAKALILETEFQGNENEIGVYTDSEDTERHSGNLG